MAATAVAAAVLSAACAARSAGPAVIDLADLPRDPTRNVAWVQSNRNAAAMAMALMERDVGLPRLEGTLRFFPDREAFRLALVEDGYPPDFADETAGRMDAIGGHRRVFFSEPALGRLSMPMRVGFIAHELTHVLQYEIGGGRRGTSDQWLREGFADWVASRVLAALEVLSADDFRQRRLREYRSWPGPLPRLDDMATFPQWVALSGNAARSALAGKAFLASELLLERHGIDGVLGYFKRFAQSEDRLGNFAAAFGEPLSAFETALDEHLRRLR